MRSEQEPQARYCELNNTDLFDASPEMLLKLQNSMRGEPLTWGATPLEPYRKDIELQQKVVRAEIGKYFPKHPKDVPFGLSWDTAQFIEDNFFMRTQRRLSRNYDSYQYRGKFDITGIPLELLGIIERSKTGHASPAEIMATTAVEQIAAADVATLSLPYGERIEYLWPMRDAIKEGIVIHGGEVLDLEPTLEVRNANFLTPNYKATEPSLLMTRTYERGKLDEDTKIIERSSFNVVLDRVAPGLSRAVQAIEYDKDWSKHILELPGVEAAVLDALSDNRFDVAVPISTTAVEVNYRLVKGLLENKEHIRNRQMLFARRALAESAKKSEI